MLGTPDNSAFRLRRVRQISGVARDGTPGAPSGPALLLEDGTDLLLEDGNPILLEE